MSHSNNSTPPLVSVIVPVYNALSYLPRCVDSILAQTYTHLEVLLVDDGSTDGSAECCDRYASDSRVRAIHKPNGGVSSARNVGIEQAQGHYISFCDSDDYLHPQMIEILVRAAEQHHCDMSICRFAYVDDTASMPSDAPLDAEEIAARYTSMLQRDDLFTRWLLGSWDESVLYIAVWNKLYTRSLIADSRFEGHLAEDSRFNAALYKRCQEAAMVDASLYRYINIATSATHSYADGLLTDISVYYDLYQHVLNEEPRYAAFCLDNVYKRFLYAKFCYRGTDQMHPMLQLFRQVKQETWHTFVSSQHISTSRKAQFLLFWHCPWLYSFCVNRILPLLHR